MSSLILQQFSELLNDPNVLIHPRKYLGHDYKKVLEFWKRVEKLTEEQIKVVDESNFVFFSENRSEWKKARDLAWEASEEVVGIVYAFHAGLAAWNATNSWAACWATRELIGGVESSVFLKMFNFYRHIKRLDVPDWIKAETRFLNTFGFKREVMNENETFDDYQTRIIESLGYKKCEMVFPDKEGYFLLDNNKIVIQYSGRSYSSYNKNAIDMFKQELRKVNLPSITLQVFKSLEVLVRNGFIKYNDDLYFLYNDYVTNFQINRNLLQRG